MSSYQTIFVIPSSATPVLGECGWEFISEKRISEDVLERIINELNLAASESYLDIDEYQGEKVKVIAMRDSYHHLESIHIRCYGGVETIDHLRDVISSLGGDEVEVFDPHSTPS
jgi:hypothetical protein